MKITRDEGERVSPSVRRIATEIRAVLAVNGAGTALWRGTRILITRGWDVLGEHFTGWEKWAALSGAGYVAAYAAAQQPEIARFVVPMSVIGWCVTAWWVSPPAPGDQATPASVMLEEPDDALTLDTLTEVVRRVAEDRQGAHLADLLQQPEFEGWQQPELKTAITRLGAPVEEFKLILGGRQRVRAGVRLRDLPPSATPDTGPEPPLSGPAVPTPRPAQHPAPDPE